MTKCDKCESSSYSSVCSSTPDCRCKKCYEPSASSCECKKDCKKCFGYWAEPRGLKCEPPCQYDYCKFKEIPTGSMYFAEHWDLFGTMRSLASKQKYSLMGLVLQLAPKGGRSEPFVLTVFYGGRVDLYKLKDLSETPLIISQAVRPKLRACNKCVEKEQRDLLIKVASRYYKKPFETDGVQVARSIFDIPASNPNENSYTDTELVYRILYESALIGNCCPKKPKRPFCPQKCLKCDCYGNCDSVSEASASCGCDCHGKDKAHDCYSEKEKCSSECCKPCERDCCESSSSSCNDCEKVDCYFASSVSICDFLTGNHMDLRWFWNLVPVFTDCQNAVVRSGAIDKSFTCQGKGIINDIRKLVECWGGGCSLAYHKRGPCECEVSTEFCGKEKNDCKKVVVHQKKCDCDHQSEKHKDKSCDCSCEKDESESEESGSADSSPSCDCRSKGSRSPDCNDPLCTGATVAIASLQAIWGQLTQQGTSTNPAQIDGTLLQSYFNSILCYLSSVCNQHVPPLGVPSTLTTYVTYTIPGGLLYTPAPPQPKVGQPAPKAQGKTQIDQIAELIARVNNLQ